MSAKDSKQFGVWMDGHHATVVGRENISEGKFVVLGHVKNDGPGSNSNENASNNLERSMRQNFFKDIGKHMINVDEVYVTGTGDAQEQFIKFLSETPQFKNARTNIATASKMGDAQLVEAITAHFH